MVKRVLYNTCAADPWVKVAKKLKEEQDLNQYTGSAMIMIIQRFLSHRFFRRQHIIHG